MNNFSEKSIKALTSKPTWSLTKIQTTKWTRHFSLQVSMRKTSSLMTVLRLRHRQQKDWYATLSNPPITAMIFLTELNRTS